MVRISRKAAKHVNNQNIQRQETPAFAINPLQTGPSVGPAKGAMVKKASISTAVKVVWVIKG